MVVHLWGKFFMAAWRGRRAMTWITGAIAFLVSIGTAFTGYLSQQNFDSQWIGGQAKDGLNAAGIGSFFNVLNFGQMLLWHVVLLPLFVGILIAGHVLLVRRRGVVPPHADRRQERMSAADYPLAPDPRVEWQGAKRRYDLVKEAVLALVAVSLLTVLLSLRLLLAGREAGHDRELGGRRAEGLRRDRAVGARRHERRRDLRAAVHPRRRRRPEHHRRALDPAGARRADPDRPGSSLRPRPALDPRADRPDARSGSARLESRDTRRAHGLGDALRQGGRPGRGCRASQPEPGRLRARADADGEPARDGPERRPRRRAQPDGPVLPDRISRRPCCSWPTAATSRRAPRSRTCSAASGG